MMQQQKNIAAWTTAESSLTVQEQEALRGGGAARTGRNPRTNKVIEIPAT